MVSKLSAAVFFALLFCTSYIILRWDVFKLRISDLFTVKRRFLWSVLLLVIRVRGERVNYGTFMNCEEKRDFF